MVDSILDETGNNPGTLRLNRTYTVGDMPVSLGFSGTASFGADYQVDLPDFSGVATIPSGSTFLDLPILPVPDSRAEGNETVIVTVLASPQGDYAVGTPSSQTLSILDDDSNQIPLNGWSLTAGHVRGRRGVWQWHQHASRRKRWLARPSGRVCGQHD